MTSDSSYLSRAAAALLCVLAAASCGQNGFPTSAGGSTEGASSATSSGSSSGSGGGGPSGTPITIVDWNTHNFFDTTGTLGVDAESATDYPKKRATIGATLKDLNPDIAVLQEIETLAVLDDLNKSELGGAYTTSL